MNQGLIQNWKFVVNNFTKSFDIEEVVENWFFEE